MFCLEASERELIWVMRATILVVAAVATGLALSTNSIYALAILSSDIVYVILFPQLLCVVHVPVSNTYGSVAGLVVGLSLRLCTGEPALRLPPLIHYPLFEVVDGAPTQFFPFRTFAMAMSLITLLLVSVISHAAFRQGWINKRWDIFKCVVDVQEAEKIGSESLGLEEQHVNKPQDTAEITGDTRHCTKQTECDWHFVRS